jgi:subtilisin family serine protease
MDSNYVENFMDKPIFRPYLNWVVVFVLWMTVWAGPVQANGMPLPSVQTSVETGVLSASFAQGLMIVGLKQTSTLTQDQLRAGWGSEIRPLLPDRNVFLMQVPVGGEQAALERARQDPTVAFAELDRLASADGNFGIEPHQTTSDVIPNDPALDQQWGLKKIGVPFAWNYSNGAPDVLVAVLDSGIQLDHPDLSGQIWTNLDEIPVNYLDDDKNGKVDDVHGWHFFHQCTSDGCILGEDANIKDDYGHGTLISGVIAAKTNNGLGVAGVAGNSQILPVKVLDQYGNGYYSDIASGIVYAADQGARIINLSLGGDNDSALLRSAVDYARARGVLVIAAAGNCGNTGKNCSPAVNYPAAYDPVLAVGASDVNDLRASFSDYGPQIDLVAPGVDIYNTWNYGNYLARSGTSLAAPYVSGTAALLWAYDPHLSLVELETLLFETAIDLNVPGKDIYTGWGRVSAASIFGRLFGIPDLWMQCQVPVGAWSGKIIPITVTYGNRGWSEVTASQINGSLSQGTQVLQNIAMDLGTLTAESGPFSQILLNVTVPAQGGPLVLDLQALPLSPDLELQNNQAHCHVNPNFPFFIPIVFSP